MKRDAFMNELEYLLQDVKEEEKEDALEYYRDYLDEAGPENEEQVIREFGSPERIAAIIRAGISGNIEDGGEFTETGYGDERFREPNFQLQKRLDLPESQEKSKDKTRESRKEDRERQEEQERDCQQHSQEEQQREERNQTGRSWRGKTDWRGTGQDGAMSNRDRRNLAVRRLLLFLILLAAVTGIFKISKGVLTAVAGIIVGICILFIGIGLAAICLILGGVAFGAFGLVTMFGELFQGLMWIGLGLLSIGFGCFALLLAIWFYGIVLPWIFHKTENVCTRLLGKERRGAV
ncbi:DUF1700 domain-containing protein [Lachnospiraceae bacterium 62-35]